MKENDWIDWHGGDCPVNFDTRVDVMLRKIGHMESGAFRARLIKNIPANLVRWIHCPADQKFITHIGYFSDDDVVKYRRIS